MPVGGGCESDRLVWPFSVSGCYSVKTGYKLIHPCYHPNHRRMRASGSHCVSKKPTLQVVDTIQRWLPPSQATLKLNVDATWDKKTLIAGLRAVIRDEHGNFIRGAGKVRLASSSVEAEAQAALYGLVVASDLGNVHLECEFDSRELILSVKGNIQKGRWTIYPFLAALKEKCRIFGSCSWKWIPRKANKAADAAAIEAKRKMCDEVWISRPPSSLVFMLQSDGLPCPPCWCISVVAEM
ncbi:hypothetical protein L3X38_005769 [Prunus dulcis]|uniref:RNase H type-1 domain-containing protein n=1 Tax=Prunus dulcis TaxID=3755 RepID=A0AAD5F4E8_PRUDU|nr:hypothetical protein L3X38_005769 [Prunus dulcis]